MAILRFPEVYMFPKVKSALLAMGLGWAGFCYGHHSFNIFDMQTRVQLHGTVADFDWSNPHTRTFVDVSDSYGQVTRWTLEGMSARYLARNGWQRTTLRPGDDVYVVINPLHSGEAGGTLRQVIKGDGTTYYMYGIPAYQQD